MTVQEQIAAPPLPRMEQPWMVRVAEPGGVDLDLIHRWMHADHVAKFWHQDWSKQAWAEELHRQRSGEHSVPCLVGLDSDPLAYVEVYRVARDRLADCYPYQPRDLGVHIAIGEPDQTGQGLGRRVLRAVADGLLAAEPECGRVVAEPDSRNVPSIRAFQAAGFAIVNEITLPDKPAALMFHQRPSSPGGLFAGKVHNADQVRQNSEESPR